MFSFYNYLVICLTIQLLSLLVPSNSQLSTKANVIVNILDDNGLRGALWFIDSIQLYNKLCLGDIYIFMHENIIEQYNSNSSSYSDISIKHFKYKNNGPIPYVGIGRPNPKPEHVSDILESWSIVQDLYSTNNKPNGLFLSISFESNYVPVATPNFLHLFERLGDKTTDNYGLILLGKVRRLTSVSDWHDVSLAVFDYNNKGFIKWLNTFKRVYFAHTLGRKAFNLLEPRPALLEANSQHIHDLSIGYFDSSEICSTTADWSRSYSPEIISKIKGLNLTSNLCHVGHVMNHTNSHGLQEDILNISHKHRNHIYGESRCHHLSIYRLDDFDTMLTRSILTSIEVYCGYNDDSNECLIVDIPNQWKRSFENNVPSDFENLIGKQKQEIVDNVMHLLWHGVIRYRNSTSTTSPKKFCWDTGSDNYEDLSFSRIEYNVTHSKPFPHSDYNRYTHSHSNISAVIMTGIRSSGQALDYRMYITISKMYYAKRHGYKHVVTTSNQYTEYFDKKLFQLITNQGKQFRGFMSKPVMVLDIMYNNIDRDWIIWTDSDVFINPGFLYMPLDIFLSNIPENKVYVAGNFVLAMTNVFAIRNNEQGRRLMRDWIAIAMSGYVQCQAYDQAALQTLLLQRFSHDSNFTSNKPLNFTCLYSAEGQLGCNAKNDYSCDYKFEKALYNAGFKTAYTRLYFGFKISSYSKGCANDFVDDFHIVTESPYRPRFQCGLCTRTSEIETAGHWEGSLGGGNDKLRRGSLNGWFFNHKSEFLFYESYINPNACIHLDGIVSDCDKIVLPNSISKEEHDNTNTKLGRHIFPLVDGYAYDIDNGEYCRITNKNVLLHQLENTYMREYKEIISLINNISDDHWSTIYKNYGGPMGRYPCADKNNICYHGPGPDGQAKRRPDPPYIYNMNKDFFEARDYCMHCKNTSINNRFGQDCRTDDEIKDELENGLNII